ncbi:MAG: hypothetical protein E6Q85_01685 [Thiothrix sp.]|nr:MAG: hypothetical protein E6Q85_01685 [Thiothrix sp.]
MKAFRWLLVHPIAFAWILAAIAIILNWIVGSGAPPKKEHQAKAGQHETQAQQGAAAHEQASTQAQAAAALPAGHGAAETKAAANAAQAPASGEQAQAASASVAEQAAAGSSATATTGTATDAQAVNENSSVEDLLLAAREAYWSGEYDRSVGFYQSLLKKDNKPDYKGELANVYWKQGKSADAVSLYAEIAPWLAEQGRVTELQSIKVYADVVDPAKAAEIGAVIK